MLKGYLPIPEPHLVYSGIKGTCLLKAGFVQQAEKVKTKTSNQGFYIKMLNQLYYFYFSTEFCQ